MRKNDRLNERQSTVLRWIGAGCPDDAQHDSSYKWTARALADRGLVKVHRPDGRWWAELTDAGRHYVDHGEHLAAPRPLAARSRRPAQAAPEPAAADENSPTITPAELLAELTRSDGARVTVPDPAPEVRAGWRRAIDAVRRNHLAPRGQALRYTGRDRGDLVIELVPNPRDGQERRQQQPAALVIPEAVSDWHPAATHQFSSISADRMVRGQRLVHALALAAEEHGLRVAARDDGLEFSRGDQVVAVRFREEHDERDVLPDVDQPTDGQRYGWQRVQPERQSVPTGRLTMVFDEDAYLAGRRRRFGDTQRWRLDDKLAQVLVEAAHRLEVKRERHEAAQRADQERQEAWQTAMARARDDFQEARRQTALDQQTAAWERVTRIRNYCDALAGVHDDRDAERAAWITWAREYADRLDPRGQRDLAPPVIEPKPHQLAEFLQGWSPYEARRR